MRWARAAGTFLPTPQCGVATLASKMPLSLLDCLLATLIAFSTTVELGRDRPTNNDHDNDSPLCPQHDQGRLEVNVGLPKLIMRCGLCCANDRCMVSPAAFQGP